MASSSAGPGKSIKLRTIKQLKNRGNGLSSKLFKRTETKIVHRLDGLRAFYAGVHLKSDDFQIELSITHPTSTAISNCKYR